MLALLSLTLGASAFFAPVAQPQTPTVVEQRLPSSLRGYASAPVYVAQQAAPSATDGLLAPLVAAGCGAAVAVLAVTGRARKALPARVPRVPAPRMETQGDLETLAKDLNPAIGFYDPLELSKAEFWNESNEATIGWIRQAEIKHGRVAMAGFVGYIVHANGIHFPWKIPGDEFCGTVSPPELWYNLPYAAKAQIIAFVGIMEWWSELRLKEGEKHYMRGGKPGYFPSFDGLPHPVPFNLYDPFQLNKNKSDEWKAKRLQIEINNGRLAMLGLMSFLSEQAVPGSVPLLKGVVPSMPYDVMTVDFALHGFK